MLIGEQAAFAQKFGRTLQNPAFAKDRFEHDCAGVLVDRFTQGGDVVLRDERYIFQQWFKTLAVLFLSRERQSAEGASMIRTV